MMTSIVEPFYMLMCGLSSPSSATNPQIIVLNFETLYVIWHMVLKCDNSKQNDVVKRAFY